MTFFLAVMVLVSQIPNAETPAAPLPAAPVIAAPISAVPSPVSPDAEAAATAKTQPSLNSGQRLSVEGNKVNGSQVLSTTYDVKKLSATQALVENTLKLERDV